MTVYIFDEWKQVRKIIPQSGVTELIHDEDNNQLHAVVDMKLRIRNGEHLGFMCADKRFRLFTVVLSEEFDDQGVTIVTGIDASVQELRETIVENCNQTATIKFTVMGLLSSAGAAGVWNVIGEDSVETKETKAYFTSVWNVLTQCEGLYLWQIIPYYTFHNGQISGRVIELAKDEAVYRGRILKSKKDATNVYVVRTDPPVTRLYVTGASAGTGDMQTSITISEISWSRAAGDPADKPAGQSWIDDTEAIRKHGLHAASIAMTHIQTPEELIKAAWTELQKRKEPTCTVEANVQDMEQVHGYQHQIIRLGDRVPIHLSNATMEAARVINIKRDYIRPWLTKVVLGERVQTIQSQMRQMQDMSSELDIGQDHAKKETEKNSTTIRDMGEKMIMNAALIQMNAEMIQMNAHVIELNAEQIRMNAEQIDMKAGKQEVTELGETVTAAMIMIDGINAQLALKATKAEVTEVSSRLSLAEIALDGANAALLLKAERTDVDALGERITSAEIKVDGANSKVDVLAEEIRLAGYVTADELETETLKVVEGATLASLKTGALNVSGIATVNTLYATGAVINNLNVPNIIIGGTAFDPADYATKAWVEDQGYLKNADFSNYATRSWVIEQNYTTASDVSQTLDGYVMSGELDGYATQAWVQENFSKASAAYKPTTIERYGSVSGNSIPVHALNESGEVLLTGTVDAGDVYSSGVSSGKNSVTLTSSGWQGSSNTVRASNGKSVVVSLPQFSASGGTSFNSSNQTTVYFSTASVSGYLASKTVDATSVYNNGWNECREACSVKRCLIDYWSVGEMLYDRDGNPAGSDWYKGTVAYLYYRPGAK